MIFVSMILIIPTIAVWLLLRIFSKKDSQKREVIYTDGVIVGYEDGGRYTRLTVQFQWNGTTVRCYSEQVYRFDFLEGSKVNIYYYPDIMRRPHYENYISGVIYINDSKYINKNRTFHRKLMIFLIVLGSFLTVLTIASFMYGILG